MTEDEAFVRAVVDAPGDDTPRLAYADWLDERGDPRGPYLRAEREAVVTGDTDWLRGLAVGLDPVWVARVSMPPVGACVEHTELTDRGPAVPAADVAEAERRLGVTFPADYRAFLLNYNGGWVGSDPGVGTPDGQRVRTDGLGWRLYPLGRVGRFVPRPFDLLPGAEGLPPLGETVESWLSRFVCVGRDPDQIGGVALGVGAPDRGRLCVLDTSIELEVAVRSAAGRPPAAATFAEFLWSLPEGIPF